MCITLIGISIFCCSCHRDCPVPTPTTCVPHEDITSLDTGFYVWTSGKEKDGYARAIKLNKEWRASALATKNNNNIDLYFITYKNFQENPDFEWYKEFLFLKIKNDKFGCFKLQGITDGIDNYTNYKCVDYDAGEDNYVLDDILDNNYLDIDTLNTLTNRISGKFMISYKKISSGRPWNLPTVRFFNGEFHCNIVN